MAGSRKSYPAFAKPCCDPDTENTKLQASDPEVSPFAARQLYLSHLYFLTSIRHGEPWEGPKNFAFR